jgi:hypothetical protein
MEIDGQSHTLVALPLGTDSVLILQEIDWAPGTVWIGAEILAPSRIYF